MKMTIGSISKQSGISRDTLRYYEKLGLLPPPIRSFSDYRIYSVETLNILHFIKHTKQVGFTLAEIKQLMTLKESSPTVCSTVKNQIQKKLQEVETKVRELNKSKKDLKLLLTQCQTSQTSSTCKALETLTTSSGD